MTAVVILYNPLDPSRRRYPHLEDGVELLAWVDENAPALDGCTRSVSLNGRPCTDASYRTRAGDQVVVAFTPAAVEVAGLVLKALLSYVIGFVLNKLFGPHQPAAGSAPQPSQVYGIAPPKNAARLGQPIPVIYGAVTALPDFAAQPFTRYENNDEFLYALLCLGQGEHDVDEMLFGQTSASVIPGDVLKWSVYGPAAHRSTFGLIEGLITGFSENMVTSPAVGDQELVAQNVGGVLVPSTWYWALVYYSTSQSPPGSGGYVDLSGAGSVDAKLLLLPQNPDLGTSASVYFGFNGSTYATGTYIASPYVQGQKVPSGSLVPPPAFSQAGIVKWVGPFETCKAGQAGQLLELDFVFPGGLYTGDASGNLQNRTVAVQVGYTPIDDTGAATGAEVLYTEQWVAKDNTPQRFSMPHTVASGRYSVRVSRSTTSDGKVTTSDRVIWAGLKFRLNPPPAGTLVYGNVTLIAVRLKATNGIAADAAGSMRFRCTRRLASLTGGPLVRTVNPADAFVDILTAPYGGARPLNGDELDVDELTSSRAAWVGVNGFNAVFDQPSTVWEALGLSVQTVHAAPLPVGSRMSLIHDQAQTLRLQLFSDANIVAGSLQVTHAFDATGTPAGVRVNYRDARSFSPLALLQPIDAPDFVTIDLFGCTSAQVAQEHANLAQAKRTLQRSSIHFETELEGLNVLPGDRIGVQAGMVAWAQGARVASVAGRTLTLDRPLAWTDGATHAVLLRDATGVPARLVGVTRGAADNVMILPSAAPFAIVGAYDQLEATSLSFGVQGSEVTDWVVAKLTPNGSRVGLDAVNYDPAIYAGAAAFTRAPIAPPHLPRPPLALLEESSP